MVKELRRLFRLDTITKEHMVEWNEYIYYGLFFSMLLMFLDGDNDGFFQIIVVCFFFVLAGFGVSYRCFVSYNKCYPVLPIVTAIYTLYYFLHETDPVSYRFPLVIYLIMFGGFCAAINCEGQLEQIYCKLWMILFAFLMIDIFTIRDKSSLYFKDSMLELAIMVFFAALTLLYLDDSKLVLAGEGLIICLGIMLFRSNEMKFSKVWKFKDAFADLMNVDMLHKIFGSGYLQIKASNTFEGLLSYYGLIAFVLVCFVIVYAIYLILFSKDKELKKQSVLVVVTLVCSVFYSAFSLMDGAYLIFVEIGILLGELSVVKERKNGY